MPKRGPQPKPERFLRSERLQVMVTPEEKRRIAVGATKRGQSVSDFLRDVGLEACGHDRSR